MAEENLTQQDFLKAVSDVCSTFGVQKLYPQQEKALSEFLIKWKRCIRKLAHGIRKILNISDGSTRGK